MIGASSPSLPSLGLEGATICSPVILKQEVTTILTKLLDSNLPTINKHLKKKIHWCLITKLSQRQGVIVKITKQEEGKC